MRPFCREVKLRADVYPMKKEMTDTTNNLDLNGTARKADKCADKFSPYMQNMTHFVLNAQLAGPITPVEVNEAQHVLYSRMIILIPYRAADQMKRLEQSFEEINIELLGLENTRYLNTTVLSPRSKQKKDFLSCFNLLDKEMRLYIIEGQTGTGRSLDRLYSRNAREHTNDRRFKMLFNADIHYKDRLYADFNLAIKKVKLRQTLSQIMSEPDIYLRSKVPIEIYDTLQKFAEMRKLERQALVRDFDLYPSADRLLNLERKYGDSLNSFDLHGQKPKKRRRRRPDQSVNNSNGETSIG